MLTSKGREWSLYTHMYAYVCQNLKPLTDLVKLCYYIDIAHLLGVPLGRLG